jgi:hypothetical protein
LRVERGKENENSMWKELIKSLKKIHVDLIKSFDFKFLILSKILKKVNSIKFNIVNKKISSTASRLRSDILSKKFLLAFLLR